MLDLVDYKHFIFGIQGSGKSHFAKYLTRAFKKPTVYRVNGDFDAENVYLFKPNNVLTDFNNFITWFIKSNHDCLVLDEADMLLGANFDLFKYPAFNDLIVNHRHLHKTVILISRRPQDVPAKIVSSCRYSFWFKVDEADQTIANKLKVVGIYELMQQLKFKDYRFIVKPIGEPAYIHERI